MYDESALVTVTHPPSGHPHSQVDDALGDAAHPTSPYAGYGAGIAIEDGYFLGKALEGRDLSDPQSLREGLAVYDDQRVAYTNKVTSFARFLGRMFHNAPKPVRKVRDFFLDHTKIPDKQISKGYTEDAQKLLRAILDADTSVAKNAAVTPLPTTPTRRTTTSKP
ncbi:FAD-dependent oxidoreductase [Rhodococcus koreensis]|uniref:FAD-dependent oxidoreductase n=1 Tax=Rhodococcus koreensis TaxID=99653 RepID=UPI0019817918|nr:hypothetical protein [Rhodococcus koreensis]QSE77756.1 hypothetical protein JWS14_00460 [Rhodococcus koreensis]